MKFLNAPLPSLTRNSWLSQAAERIMIALAVVLFIAGVLIGLNPAREGLGTILRWAPFAVFLPVAWHRRSLLVWTFFAMLAGAMLGADAPHAAGQLKFLGDIFLRLIRM